MNGTWKVTGGDGVPVFPALAAVLAVAVVSYLATILLILAVVLAAVAVLGAVILALLWRLSRPHPRDQELLTERWAAMHQGTARQAVPPSAPHYHLHVERGTDLSGLGFEAFPLRDDVTEIKED